MKILTQLLLNQCFFFQPKTACQKGKKSNMSDAPKVLIDTNFNTIGDDGQGRFGAGESQ